MSGAAAARAAACEEGTARRSTGGSTGASSRSSRRGSSCASSTSLALESYLQGVVAGEVPYSWPAEALKAQAVAARSYALASLVKGKPFDLYSDARSQVYLGVAGEKASTTQAVTATAGEVVLYGGKVATTYYFSTSGGKTASAADVFGFAVPYLVSRPDPWDKLSPYHRWGPVLLGARTVQSKLGLDARVVDATGTATPSGRLRALVVKTASGSGVGSGHARPTALGLRSTWISVGVLRLDRPSADSIVFGSTTRLSGVGRGLAAPRLASSPDGAAWSGAGTVTPDAVGRDLGRREARAHDCATASRPRAEPLRRCSSRSRRASRWLGRPRWSPRSSPGPCARACPERSSRWSGARGRRGSLSARRRSTQPERSALELDALVPAGSYRARISATEGLAAGTSAVVQVSA